MDVIKYFLFLRIKRLYSFKSNLKRTVFDLVLLIFSILYGFVFFKLAFFLKHENVGILYNQFLNYILFFIFVLTIIRGFFPKYNPIKEFSKPNYPLSNSKRLIINSINEYFHPYFINTFAFSLVFSFLIGNVFYFFQCVFIIVFSHLLRKILHIVFEVKGYIITSKKIYYLNWILIIVLIIDFILPFSTYSS